MLALGVLAAGRAVRHQLLVGPDGAWRQELWLDRLLDPAAADTGALAGPLAGGAAGDTAQVPGRAGTASPDTSLPTAVGRSAARAAATAGRPDEGPGRRRSGARPGAWTGRLDPNTAPADSLQLLPGVGPVLAERIVAARDSGPPFRCPADLRRVKGIGPASVARLGPFLRFADRAPGGSGADNPH